jgi:osomolarity two-component system sensor histidine kinase SLN1
LEAALSSFGSSFLLLQAIVYPNTHDAPEALYGIVNVTGEGVTGAIELPYTHPDGSPVYLGEPGMGYPRSLYPNLTYKRGPHDEAQVFIGRTQLGYNTTFFIGPLSITDSLALFSVTMAVNNNTSRSETLGWITVVIDANMLYDVVLSPEGLAGTGELLLVGPNVKHNKFRTEIRGNSAEQVNNRTVKFVLPPPSNSTLGNRHPLRSWQDGNSSRVFNMSDYPAVVDAWSSQNHDVNNAGALISTHNEENIKVSAGYAIVPNPLVDWAVVIEQSTCNVPPSVILTLANASSAVTQSPISHLRNIVLACKSSSSLPHQSPVLTGH